MLAHRGTTHRGTERRAGGEPFLFRTAASLAYCGEAPIKTTLSFQNLEAAVSQAADPTARESSRCRNWRLLIQFRRRMDGAHGGIDEMGMQSEPCLPRTILYVCSRQCGEEGAADRDTFMRTVRTCTSTRSPIPRQSKLDITLADDPERAVNGQPRLQAFRRLSQIFPCIAATAFN